MWSSIKLFDVVLERFDGGSALAPRPLLLSLGTWTNQGVHLLRGGVEFFRPRADGFFRRESPQF
jgi:hypothetical protein